MTDEMKKDFTLRITQANRSGIVVLTYELALQYIEDAENAADRDGFNRSVRNARSCVEQLRGVLDHTLEISLYLYRIYNYISVLMDKAMIRHSTRTLSEAKALLRKLHDAFEQVADSDSSGPVMKNTETVYSGLTYGRNGIRDNVAQASRGFAI